jgi:hypothetical protein
MNELSELARNTAAGAISTGWAARCIGFSLPNDAALSAREGVKGKPSLV